MIPRASGFEARGLKVPMNQRISPLKMTLEPEHLVSQNGWQIIYAYLGEKRSSQLFVTDLSHVPKWSLQGSNDHIAEHAGLPLPANPGDVVLERGILLVCLCPGEYRMMALGDETLLITDSLYSDLTDAFASFAVVGPTCLEVLSKLCSADLDAPTLPPLIAAQAPIAGVTGLVVYMAREDDLNGLIVSCARGYGQYLLEAFLDAGREFDIAVAGWERFNRWMKTLS